MKKYTVKENEDLGLVARKFGVPSWKYLYQLNKDTIGDNPDLLKAGTVLDMPTWDSTSGDEKLKAKEAEPQEWTGMGYRYPWVALSVSLVKPNGTELAKDPDAEKNVVITDRALKTELFNGKMKKSDDIETLIPDAESINIQIDGTPLIINGTIHCEDVKGLQGKIS